MPSVLVMSAVDVNASTRVDLERLVMLQIREQPCLWRPRHFEKLDIKGDLGFDSFAALWRDYTVVTIVRNPYDRAASAYDYCARGRHKASSVTSFHLNYFF
jgi:hypothetical protein